MEDIVWGFLNSNVGLGMIGSATVFILNYLYGRKSFIEKYEGTIIHAIKLAEKEIPNDNPSKAMARLDTALQYVLKVYEDVQGKRATAKETAEIKAAISAKHSEVM